MLTTRDVLGYPRHPGTEGTFVTWDFGYQCLTWDKSGHPGIFRSCTLHFLYVEQLGKPMAVLDLQSHLCRDSLFVLVALSAQYRVNVDA